MRKATFDRRMQRVTIIARRAERLFVGGQKEEANHLLLETKAVRQFRGLLDDFLFRYAGIQPSAMIARHPDGDV